MEHMPTRLIPFVGLVTWHTNGDSYICQSSHESTRPDQLFLAYSKGYTGSDVFWTEEVSTDLDHHPIVTEQHGPFKMTILSEGLGVTNPKMS